MDNMLNLLDEQDEFETAAESHGALTVETLKLRIALLDEEHQELKDELDALVLQCTNGVVDGETLANLVAESCDVLYVVLGTINALGLDAEMARMWKAIHKANMNKADPTTGRFIYRDDGKILKPEDWEAVDKVAVFNG